MPGWMSASSGGWNHLISSGELRSHARIQKAFSWEGAGPRENCVFRGWLGWGGGGWYLFSVLYYEKLKKKSIFTREGVSRTPPPFHAPDQRMISSQWSAPQCSLKFSFSNNCILNYDIKKSQWLHTIVLAIYKSWLFPGRKS